MRRRRFLVLAALFALAVGLWLWPRPTASASRGPTPRPMRRVLSHPGLAAETTVRFVEV